MGRCATDAADGAGREEAKAEEKRVRAAGKAVAPRRSKTEASVIRSCRRVLSGGCVSGGLCVGSYSKIVAAQISTGGREARQGKGEAAS